MHLSWLFQGQENLNANSAKGECPEFFIEFCNSQQWVEHFLNHGGAKSLRKTR